MNISEINSTEWIQKRKREDSDYASDKSSKKSRPGFYFTLANESPPRYDSDDNSSYDSLHNQETDVCKDTSDTDASNDSFGTNCTETIATMEVFEYEVASSTGDENDAETGSLFSSSGSEDFALEAAANCYYALYESSNTDTFLFADTEESEGSSFDPELGKADYWTCIKCKNKQNNPLYRYCEKCYQIRKSLFPPRPKVKKTRSERSLKRKMASPYYSEGSEAESVGQSPIKRSTPSITASPSTEATSGTTFGNINRKIPKIKSKSMTSGYKNSAGEQSCNNNSSLDSTDVEDDGKVTKKYKLSSSTSLEITKVDHFDELIEGTSQTSHVAHVALSSNFKLNNKQIQNVLKQHQKAPTSDFKDSGCSSCPSSQEFEYNLARSASSDSSQSLAGSQVFGKPVKTAEESDDSEDEKILNKVDEFSKQSSETKQKLLSECLTKMRSNPELPRSSETMDPASDVNESNLGLCRFCLVNPKDGVFVHNNCLHLCCCYKCAVKVWKKRKSCPICNCKVKNVTKLFVH